MGVNGLSCDSTWSTCAADPEAEVQNPEAGPQVAETRGVPGGGGTQAASASKRGRSSEE